MNVKAISTEELDRCIFGWLRGEVINYSHSFRGLAEKARREQNGSDPACSFYTKLVKKYGLDDSTALRRHRIICMMLRVSSTMEEEILRLFAIRKVSIEGMFLIASHVTFDNAEEILKVVPGKTCREIASYLVERFPHSAKRKKDDSAKPVIIPPMGGGPIENGTVGLELRVTLEGDSVNDLYRLKEMYPIKTYSMIVATAVRSYRNMRDPLVRGKRGKVKPKSTPGVRSAIPHSMCSNVYLRDGGRCTFVGSDGERCFETSYLEFDHIVPVAKGGTNEENNLRLLCRVHNQHMADVHFGKSFMDAKRKAPL